MSDPELLSPQEWAEELRQKAASLRLGGSSEHWPDDCDELADRMDDLAEALRLLREARRPVPLESEWLRSRSALLAKYASDEG